VPRRRDQPPPQATTVLGDNVRRVLGLHALSAVRAAEFLGLSPQAMSELQWRPQPRIATINVIADFFEIDLTRLWRTPFAELLADELSDLKRFQRVERKLAKLDPGRAKPRLPRS
jgi:hypothetical protein